ncbi:hypothetical protein QE431_002216 [Flavobacterium sp. SORGH_AS 622]|nr:hypothetical protein [Flavobacterium sp. SORGH_AS_0622]
MKKSLEQQYIDVKDEIRNHFNEFEKESKIEMIIIKALIILLFFGLTFLILI